MTVSTTSTAPAAALGVLPRADGSAKYSHAGYTVTASVNGPIEAQRRDEHPYEAHVDVIVRPAAGVGGTRERHLESILQSSLSQIILVKNFPRSLIQIVLQVEDSPENDYVNTKLVQASLNFSIMPALFQTAVLALLSAGVPIRATATATAIAIVPQDGTKRSVVDPSPRDVEIAQSVHVLAFTSHDELLLAESEGDFTVKEWDDVYETAKDVCCRPVPTKEGMEMVLDDEHTNGPDLRHFLRSTMENKVASDLHWK
ncbi:exosome non-catalytic core subunit rrp46 [Podospora pseudopauciseta]|uniref:Exosome non-catalytic core subunit rrp46 n=1 Tax=Podospora pseudopauciseta TaxID=2093780 RepID=A0ABR0HW55_9PEZI|nr:exosome non-catalytic core subunit rrp46 [Podospora pseudopauciseta]